MEYLHGIKRELYPHSITLDFANLRVFTIRVIANAPNTALPIGMKLQENQLASQQLQPKQFPSLMHSLLCVLYAASGSCDDLLRANAVGFVWVSAVDVDKQKVTLLAPSPLHTPSPTLLSGSLKWSMVESR